MDVGGRTIGGPGLSQAGGEVGAMAVRGRGDPPCGIAIVTRIASASRGGR